MHKYHRKAFVAVAAVVIAVATIGMSTPSASAASSVREARAVCGFDYFLVSQTPVTGPAGHVQVGDLYILRNRAGAYCATTLANAWAIGGRPAAMMTVQAGTCERHAVHEDVTHQRLVAGPIRFQTLGKWQYGSIYAEGIKYDTKGAGSDC